jgi:hypothetical protein
MICVLPQQSSDKGDDDLKPQRIKGTNYIIELNVFPIITVRYYGAWRTPPSLIIVLLMTRCLLLACHYRRRVYERNGVVVKTRWAIIKK